MTAVTKGRYVPEAGYVHGWAPRRLVENWLAKGWEAVPGSSPDGFTWRGDAMLVRMKVEDHKELTKRSREPYDALRQRIDKGETPVDTSNVAIGRITTERTTSGQAQPKK